MGKYTLFGDVRGGYETGENRKKIEKILFFFRDWVVALGFPMIFRFSGLNSEMQKTPLAEAMIL